MRKLLIGVVTSFVIFANVGCSAAAQLKNAAEGIESYTNNMIPEYEKYLDLDPQYKDKPQDLKYRKEAIAGLLKFLRTMKGEEK